jgi:hypothetical protein
MYSQLFRYSRYHSVQPKLIIDDGAGLAAFFHQIRSLHHLDLDSASA